MENYYHIVLLTPTTTTCRIMVYAYMLAGIIDTIIFQLKYIALMLLLLTFKVLKMETR